MQVGTLRRQHDKELREACIDGCDKAQLRWLQAKVRESLVVRLPERLDQTHYLGQAIHEAGEARLRHLDRIGEDGHLPEDLLGQH